MGRQKFTSEEEKCISDKVSYLTKNEGMKQDQAVAVAIKKCAPSKSNKMQSHDYSKGREGYSTIYDVPIMAEVDPGERGNKEKITRKWMEAAVLKAQLRWKNDGYKAPLHVAHHDAGGTTEAAGFVMPREVREMDYEGKKIWAVFADLEVKDEILGRIEKRELPYRSVEIFSWDKDPEINSLALLGDDVPFFRFPLLTLGRETSEAQKFKTKKPVVAARYSEAGSAILFSFKGGIMPKKLQEDLPEEEKIVEDDTEEAVEKQDEEEVQLQEVDPLAEITDLLRAIAAAVGIEPAGEDVVVEEEAVEEAQPPVEEFKGGSAIAKLSGKVAALESQMAKTKRKAQLVNLVDVGYAKLEGLAADENLKTQIFSIAENSRDPKKAIDTFVESFKNSVPMTPPATFEEYQAGLGQHEKPEVMRFGEQGPEVLAKAREASKQYDELESRGVIHSSREAFIQTSMETEN